MDFKQPRRPIGGQPPRPGSTGPRPVSPFGAQPTSQARPVQPQQTSMRPAAHTPQQLHRPVAQHPTSQTARPVARPTTSAPVSQQAKPAAKPQTAGAKRRFSVKKLVIVAVIALVIVGAAAIAIVHFTSGPTTPANKVGSTTKELGFDAVLPGDKSIKDLGGWKRVSPTTSDPVYAYSDTIDSVGITVSEQALPQSFLANVDTKVAVLATDYNATDKLSAGATTFYIGKSAQGPQSVIFTKNGLLVLIKSQKVIQDALWMQYIGSLN